MYMVVGREEEGFGAGYLKALVVLMASTKGLGWGQATEVARKPADRDIGCVAAAEAGAEAGAGAE